MKTIPILLAITLVFAACDVSVVDTTPPAIPSGLTSISLDNAIQLNWNDNAERDLAGYHVWVSDRYDGRYQLIGTTKDPLFVDYGAANGVTYFYGVTAFDFEGNESEMSRDALQDTPRPEGYGVRLYDFHAFPNDAGYEFSTSSIGPYDDQYSDVFFENYGGTLYLDVWSDTDIQDMGYTATLDDISVAPTTGWAPSKSAEAIKGHTYVIWTWDDHYAKVRITDITSSSVLFDWAYQTSTGNPELKRELPPDGKRKIHSNLFAR